MIVKTYNTRIGLLSRIFTVGLACLLGAHSDLAISEPPPARCDALSKIEIDPPPAAKLSGKVELAYVASHARCSNVNSIITCEYWEGSSIRFKDKEYSLRNFNIIAPSRYSIANKSFPLEIELNNRSVDGSSLIVSLLIAPGSNNPALDTFVERLPHSEDIINVDDQAFQIPLLFSNVRSLLAFESGKVIDQCTDKSVRLVAELPIPASASQISAISKRFTTQASRANKPSGTRASHLERFSVATVLPSTG